MKLGACFATVRVIRSLVRSLLVFAICSRSFHFGVNNSISIFNVFSYNTFVDLQASRHEKTEKGGISGWGLEGAFSLSIGLF